MKVVVRRASQVHQVPQVGLPHIDPVARVKSVKIRPISLAALPEKSVHVFLVNKPHREEIKRTKAKKNEAKAAGTCKYMIR